MYNDDDSGSDLYSGYPGATEADLDQAERERAEQAKYQDAPPEGDYRCQLVGWTTRLTESPESPLNGLPVSRLQLKCFLDDGTTRMAFVSATGIVVRTAKGRLTEASNVGLALIRETQTAGKHFEHDTLEQAKTMMFVMNLGYKAASGEYSARNFVRFGRKGASLPGLQRVVS